MEFSQGKIKDELSPKKVGRFLTNSSLIVLQYLSAGNYNLWSRDKNSMYAMQETDRGWESTLQRSCTNQYGRLWL